MRPPRLALSACLALGASPASRAVPPADRNLDDLRSNLNPALAGSGTGSSSAESAAAKGREIQNIISQVKGIKPSAADSSRDAVWGARPATPAAKLIATKEEAASAQGAAAPVPDAQEDETSSFGEVWKTLKQNPLTTPYPKSSVSFLSFFKGMSFHLLDSARRTLDDHRDLLPDFKKLIRPNGIALAGVWEITEKTPYSGYFAKGSRALVIARASVFSDDTDQGEYRSFGMALKLYPTEDFADAKKYKTANVFLIDDNGGTQTPHFTDAALTTHPKLSFHGGLLLRSPILAAVTLAQRMADKNSDYRQLYPVSQLGVSSEALPQVKTPQRLLLRGAQGTPKVNAKDFREELDAAKYASPGLEFDVFTAAGKDDEWKKIGRVRFTDSAVSHAVDHNLHFPHPRYQESRGDDY